MKLNYAIAMMVIQRQVAERKGFDAANDGEAVVAPLKPASTPRTRRT
jgi:hypothetical protein